MTEALEAALREARKLSAAEQDALAEAILAEITAEAAWPDTLARSRDVLAQLADEALAEHRAGTTLSLDAG